MKCSIIFTKLSTAFPLLLYIPLLNSFICSPPGATISTTDDVDLGYAIYRGIYNETINQTNFLGIRYAASPTGKNADLFYVFKIPDSSHFR